MEVNKIYLGDCYELIKKIPDKSIDCIYTDVPYLYQQGGSGSSELGTRTAKKRLELMGITDLPENANFNLELKRARKEKCEDNNSLENGIDFSIFDEFSRVMKKTNIFIWCSKLQLLDIMNYWITNKKCLFELLVWCKTNPTPTTNNSWLPDIEYCLYFRESGVKLNDGYFLKSKWFTTPINKNDKDDYGHPTIKPLELVKRHIEHSTKIGDVVLDPFMGSGTTAVACKELNRQYIGFEIDKKFYKIADDRLNGIKANGQTDLFNTDFEQLDLFKE
jgi:DNA modification methylase